MIENNLYKVILAPHVSEKSAMAAEISGQHTFKVCVDATKTQIKNAVEKLFSVKVASVRVSVVKGKSKRHGARMGRRPNWKKAVVRLAEGQDIDFAGLENN